MRSPSPCLTAGRSRAMIIDLTELLQRSLRDKGGGATQDRSAARPAAKKAATKTARKPSGTAAPARRKAA